MADIQIGIPTDVITGIIENTVIIPPNTVFIKIGIRVIPPSGLLSADAADSVN